MSRRTGRWRLVAAGIIAVAYLLVMAITGALPRSRQLVEFEAKGVLLVPPEAVQRVVLRSDASQLSFKRRAQGWVTEGSEALLAPPQASALDLAVKFMHTSAPVRVLTVDPVEDGNTFGLDPPHLTIELADADKVLLESSFGSLNADGFLQYMRVLGRDEVFLMSRFVGAQWRTVAATDTP